MIEHSTRILQPEELDKLLPAMLEAGISVPLAVTGGSMVPFLAGGRDSVLLSAIDRPLRRGDILLYRRTDGAWVLHRICKLRDNELWMLGDAQQTIERGIRPQQAAALVTGVRRKNKNLRPSSLTWRFFAGIWLWLRPMRPMLLRLRRGRKAV